MDDNSFPLRHKFSLSAEWLDVRAWRCARINHVQVSTIWRLPDLIRMSLKQTLFTRLLDLGRKEPTHSDKIENTQVQHGSNVSSDQHWVRGCASSGRSTTGRRLLPDLISCVISRVHISFTNNGTKSSDVHEMCFCHQLTKSKYSWPLPPSTEDTSAGSPSDLPSATCRRTPVLLTEHVDTEVSRSRSTNQSFIRNLRSNHFCPVPAISSPVSIRPLTYLPSLPQCKRSFSSMP